MIKKFELVVEGLMNKIHPRIINTSELRNVVGGSWARLIKEVNNEK